jgi:hypothetical protein
MASADTGLSVHAAFSTYENDGDLDMYLVETKLQEEKRQASVVTEQGLTV